MAKKVYQFFHLASSRSIHKDKKKKKKKYCPVNLLYFAHS